MKLKTQNRKFLPTLVFFIMISLVVQIAIISLKTNSAKKNTSITKAQENQCPKILTVGSNIAANNSPANYQQIRALYNQQNAQVPCVSKSSIPTTVVYDLFFLKGGSDGITQNLKEMAKNGLFPIIRVASYTSGNTWIKLCPPTDALIMGENLGKALDAVKGNFPATPIVVYLNEVNLHAEWGGKTDPEEFAESFDAFYKGLSKGNNYSLFFPPLSYGATGANGIPPQEFINRFFASKKFNRKLSGVALNIYGSDYEDIKTQFNNQLMAFGSSNSQIPTVIIELGPVRSGRAVSNCESDQEGWQTAAGPIAKGVIQNNLSLATMACFGSVTYPAIVHYDESAPELIKLKDSSGQIENNTTAVNNKQQNQATNSATSINFNPQNPVANTPFKTVISSETGFVWVHMKIFDKDGKKLIQEGGKTADQPKVSKTNNGYQWVYDADGLAEGEYKVIFYSGCDQGCKEQSSRTLVIGAGKTNEVKQEKITTQTTDTTSTKTNNQKQQTNTNNQQNTIVTNAPEQITFLKDDLNKIGGGGTVDYSTTEYCYSITEKDRRCKRAQTNITNDTITIAYPKDNPPQGFCFDLRNNPNAHLVCIYNPNK